MLSNGVIEEVLGVTIGVWHFCKYVHDHKKCNGWGERWVRWGRGEETFGGGAYGVSECDSATDISGTGL